MASIQANVWQLDKDGEDGDLVPGVVIVERADSDEIAVHVRANGDDATNSAYLTRFQVGRLVAAIEIAAEGE